MADERIVLAYDSSEAIASAGKANQAIAANEKTAERAGAAIGKATDAQLTSIVSITDRSQAAINRIVANAERKASLATGTPAERLASERKLQLSRVAGDQAAVNRVTAAYDKLALAQDKASAGGSKLGDALRNPMEAARGAIESVAGELGTIGAVALGAVAGLVAAAKASFDLVVSQGRAAEAIANFADQVGLSATEAYQLDIQAKIVGSSLEAVSGGYKKLAQGIQEGTEEGKKSADALDKIGVRIYELDGAVRPFGELFGDIARKVRAIEEPTARAAKVVEIFGKSGLSLLPLLLQFDETSAAAKRASEGMNDSLIKTLGAADDAIDELQGSWNTLKAELAGGILATITFVQSINKGPLDYMLPDGKALIEGAAKRRAEAIAETNRKILADEGAAAINRFRLAQGETEAKLKEQLSDVTSRRRAAEQFGPGMGVEAVSKRIALINQLSKEESALTAKIEARAKAEQEAEAAKAKARTDAEKMTKAAREFSADVGAVYPAEEVRFKVEEMRERVKKVQEEEFKSALKLDNEILDLSVANRKTELSEGEILSQNARDKELAKLEGFYARTLQQKIAIEQKKAEIERDYLLKTYAIKSELLEIDQFSELAKAEHSAELQDAINQKYALAARELTLKTEAARAAVVDTAAIKSAELVRDQAQKNFDSVKSAAEGLFDTLVLRTKSWGDLLKNAVLLPALTLVKQLVSTAIAGALTGNRGGGAGSGIGGLLGGLLGGGGLARAGAPGGTPGFAGPVTSIPGAAGIGWGQTANGQIVPLGGQLAGGFGGVSGIGGLAGLKSSGLGILTQLGQIGATNKLFQSGVYGAKGGALLGGGAILAYDGLRRGGFTGLAETTAGGALIGAKFGGPIGALIGGAIGAAAGTARLFIKGAQDKLISKIKAVYGINIDASFAKNPLMGIIKDQFGGDIDMGIRSPIVKELLAVYRMQSNQAGAGSGLGALNNVARGVSLSGYGGGVFQNPVSVNGGSYGYGGSLPSTGPAQPFQPETRPIVIENRLQIDGRDIQASVQRTNQASNGRRESAAVLSDPLLIFG